MININIYTRILSELFIDRNNINNSLKHIKDLYKLNDSNINDIKNNLFSFLHHYQKLKQEIFSLFPDIDLFSSEYFSFLITLYFLRYTKKNTEEIERSYYEAFTSLLLNPLYKDAYNKILDASKNKYVINESIKSDPVLYNSINLEVSKFFLEELIKYYSHDEVLKIIKAINNNDYIYLSKESLINKKVECKNQTSNNDIKILPIEINAYSLIEELLPGSKVLHLGKADTSWILNILLNNQINYSYFFADEIEEKAFKEIIKKEKLKKIESITSSFDLLKTHIKYDDYNLVIYRGDSLDTGLNNIYPNIIPTLEKNDFVLSYKRQLKNLIEASKFVSKKGLLLFYNHSINHIEGEEVIKSFLNNYHSFKMINNFKRLDNNQNLCGYVSLLKKE